MKNFKSFAYLVVLNLALLVMIGCGDIASSKWDSAHKIQIKGNFISKGIPSYAKVSKASDASNAVKVIVFDTNERYNISNITNGTFSIRTDKNYPAGSNLFFGSNTYTGSVSKNSTGFIAGIFPDLGTSSTSIPLAGIYTYALSNGSSYSVDVPDQSSANTSIILPVPTITLNSNGIMKKITWVYKNISGDDITPDLISEYGVMVQYEDESSVWMKGTTEYTFADQTYEWSSFYRIILAYNEIYGNHYVIVFNKS